MASARNLCQHSDIDGTQCTANDYILCPHCQLQLCLKHLNIHQTFLRSDFYHFCDHVNHVQYNFNQLVFDTNNHRGELFHKLDQWYEERSHALRKLYMEKKQQLQILCIQAHMEFEAYKTKIERKLKKSLIQQLICVGKRKQIDLEDLSEMKEKADCIEKGMDELKQLMIEIYPEKTLLDVHIIKRPYTEVTKSVFNDDDDDLWSIDGEDEKNVPSDDIEFLEELSNPSSPDIILLSPSVPCSTPPPSPTLSVPLKKAPLKFIIKRLQQPTTSTKAKYKLMHTIPSSSTLIT